MSASGSKRVVWREVLAVAGDVGDANLIQYAMQELLRALAGDERAICCPQQDLLARRPLFGSFEGAWILFLAVDEQMQAAAIPYRRHVKPLFQDGRPI